MCLLNTKRAMGNHLMNSDVELSVSTAAKAAVTTVTRRAHPDSLFVSFCRSHKTNFISLCDVCVLGCRVAEWP